MGERDSWRTDSTPPSPVLFIADVLPGLPESEIAALVSPFCMSSHGKPLAVFLFTQSKDRPDPTQHMLVEFGDERDASACLTWIRMESVELCGKVLKAKFSSKRSLERNGAENFKPPARHRSRSRSRRRGPPPEPFRSRVPPSKVIMFGDVPIGCEDAEIRAFCERFNTSGQRLKVFQFNQEKNRERPTQHAFVEFGSIADATALLQHTHDNPQKMRGNLVKADYAKRQTLEHGGRKDAASDVLLFKDIRAEGEGRWEQLLRPFRGLVRCSTHRPAHGTSVIGFAHFETVEDAIAVHEFFAEVEVVFCGRRLVTEFKR